MNSTFWNNYGLLAYIAKQLGVYGSLGKTKLQKLVFLMKELKNIPVQYRFHFYTYGPFSSDLAGDLSYLDYIDGVKIHSDPYQNGYEIRPGHATEHLIQKANGFLNWNRPAIDDILNQFGSKQARDLELIATLVYIARYSPVYQERDQDYLIFQAKELKPKFSEAEIDSAISELQGFGYLREVVH